MLVEQRKFEAPCFGVEARGIRVLHVIGSVDPRTGGPIEGVFSSAEVWSRHGHCLHVLSLDAPDSPWVATARAPTTGLGFSGAVSRALKWAPWTRYGYTPHLVRWLRANAETYDAIVVNGLWNYASFGAWRALRQGPTPYYVFTNGMLDPWFNTAYPVKTFFKRIYWRLIQHRVLRDAAGVCFTAKEERQLARTSFAPYAAREFVFGYGARDIEGDADAQRAAFFQKTPRAQGRRFALFLGRIHEKKGIDLLIDAFARWASVYPDVDLVVAGPDQRGLASRLQAQAAELGVAGRIHWPGMLTGDAKYGAFRAADVFVLPSHQENFGIAVAESMAAATPVLITDKVNIWREIEAAGAGVVVADTRAGVGEGLRTMLGLSEHERKGMSDAARRCFLEHYNFEKNAMDLVVLLRRESSQNSSLRAETS